jgi:DNA-binding NarL/FixJ family response regulator
MKPYRILLADDHSLLREAIKKSLEKVRGLKVIGEARDGSELMQILSRTTPDLIILDISMPKLSGLDAAKIIKARNPDVKILILTMHKFTEFLRRALAIGIEGYLLKENALADLVNAIGTIRRGEIYISSLLGGKVFREEIGSRLSGEVLSPREIEILKFVAQGKSSKEIADSLSLSIMTVYNHRVNIKNKLRLKKNAELVRYAIENGYI